MNNLIEFFKKIYSRLIPVKNNRVIFWDGTPNSGSNIKILYESFKEAHEEYDSIYFTRQQYISNLFKYITLVSTAKVIVTSHGCSNLKKSQTYIETWHGVPLKKLGLLSTGKSPAEADIYISSSEMYTTLLNACIGSNKKYEITGFPRNDYFFKSNKKVEEIFSYLNIKNGNKKLVFMPTYRTALGRVESSIDRKLNVLGIDNVDIEEVNEFLQENNINIIIKLHPAEESLYIDSIKNLSNINLITKSYLDENNIDIYEILRYSDGLITDYSSVYFDYLLLDKPIIFFNNDISEYEENRGFLLEPVDYWMPGEKVKSYDEFKKGIEDIAKNNDKYVEARRDIRNIVHRHKDGNSCNRVNEKILEALKER
ncbi:CDP-glycerol glycerophosphotransferase family protein [Clostridium celatum]|uniref:CDP-glycerol:poly(Glycerophosphate) glycerophosphotransferase n=1 Tax=Clostridium celatum DSM 1785 TaxID=545697 RepID=L1QNJ2_9CLOT|nr:CDP-glycerol glycerophosphotransferase family protein [Clostridium celatum]EKY29491.1 CDP-glycerol:poly(glycerophosphate) glycerophosphotransferase [Clostridium celatum DSM 1785]MCE9656221.1 CDP-glycerol glycerophosphotransferase family protein [Clostridium celatum]MDU6294625.1 CDP-glycerol glycerophosphotransferase family protein [Clostridium celatum]